jgi:hypothetical protein
MDNNQSLLPIDEAALSPYDEAALRHLREVRWRAKPLGKEDSEINPDAFRIAPTGDGKIEQSVSLLKLARAISRNPDILSDNANHVINVVRQALRLGLFMSQSYTRASGLEQLYQANKQDSLSDNKKSEFQEKNITASAVRLHTMAYYIVWKLSRYQSEAVSSIKLDLGGLPEFNIFNPVSALTCTMYYYGAYLEQSGRVFTDLDFVKATIVYFEAVIAEVKRVAGSLNYTDFFTSVGYKLTDEDFVINGFEADVTGAATSIEFNRVDINSIVGNEDAKHQSRRVVDRLLCYDPREKRNIMAELGGIPRLRLGHGVPGTGKSMLISAIATLLDDRCKWLGIPFLFWPLPDTVVSTFQGGSAERMANWMAVLRDPTKIIYAPIDDAENNLEDRTRQGVSAGVREVIAVFLRNTEGAYAVDLGNTLLDLFTNIPDQIDPAALSRVIEKFMIGGAKTWKDFLDQDYLWWRRYGKLDPNFITMTDPVDYQYLSAQQAVSDLSQTYGDYREPRQAAIKKLYEETLATCRLEEQLFFARLFDAVKRQFPRFSSRDVRNIQRAVDGRLLDFDFPTDWLSSPEVFFRQPSDTKMSMVKELMREKMKGLSFAEVRSQEAIRYLDNLVEITETGHNREIERLAESMRLQLAAQKKVAQDQ